MAKTDYSVARGLPASVDAERCILGAVLLDNVCYSEAAESLKRDDFSLDSHRRIFDAMSSLAEQNRAIDPITLGEVFQQRRELEAIGGAVYLAGLTDGLPVRPSIEQYIRIVHGKAILRELIHGANATIAEVMEQSETADEILSSAESRLFAISEHAVTRSFSSMRDAFRESYGSMDRFYEPGAGGGIKTGLADFDRLTGGLHKQDLIVIAARPSIGKTALATTIAEQVSVNDKKSVGVFSLEMSKSALLERIACAMAKVSSDELRTGLDNDEKFRMTNAVAQLLGAPLYVDDTPGLKVTEMRAKARRLKHRHGLDMLIVDYLQLMSAVGKYSNRTEAVTEFSRGLKCLAKELDCPVVALSQLSRACESREDKRPLLSDLRESGSIEQDADVVAFIFREEVYKPHDETLRGVAELIVRKQRNGPTDTIRLKWLGKYATFKNLAVECAASGLGR